MVFSSQVFLFFFLPLALAVYHACPPRGRHLALTVLSYLFYGWSNPAFVLLLLASTVIDFTCGLVMTSPAAGSGRRLERGGERTRTQALALGCSIVSNLSLLGFFKYFDFAVGSYDSLVTALGLPEASLDLALRVTLPLGISFYTFQSMSYTIDVYRGDAPALPRFVDFACYVSMFPQLVAGPIIRYREIAAQLASRTHDVAKFSRGVAFLSCGLAKKVLLANPCGEVATVVFEAAEVSTLDAWYGMVAYSFQIYFDFSGYSDMAIGLGLMLGFVFPKNFDSPYSSASITEFWRRWHLSLSRWLRDYLYIPLGGSRSGRTRTYLNLMIVMLLGGLWHGASWTFVAWGGIHGGLLALERMRGESAPARRWPRPARTALTFVVVSIAWVFFRSDTLPQAMTYCATLVGLHDAGPSAALVSGLIRQPYSLLTVAAAAVVTWSFPQTWDWTRRLTWPKILAVFLAFVAAVAVLSTQSFNPFIYFIF